MRPKKGVLVVCEDHDLLCDLRFVVETRFPQLRVQRVAKVAELRAALDAEERLYVALHLRTGSAVDETLETCLAQRGRQYVWLEAYLDGSGGGSVARSRADRVVRAATVVMLCPLLAAAAKGQRAVRERALSAVCNVVLEAA